MASRLHQLSQCVLKHTTLLRSASRSTSIQRCMSTTSSRSIPEEDKPLTFRGSNAEKWKAVDTFFPPKREAPWYEKWICMVSLTAFLMYFLVLREENEMDETLGKSLFVRIPGLEEHTLIVAIEQNKKSGKDTKALEERLEEIQASKASK